jgi:hypothetical protein
MNAAHWLRIKEIFRAALKRTPDERKDFLDEACGANHVLRTQVEALLASHEESAGFMELPADAEPFTGREEAQGS